MWQLAIPIVQMLYSVFQSIKANKELKKLGNEDISYKATPESQYLLGLTKNNAQHGYSAAEKAAFLQTVAANTAKSYRLGMNRAGNSLSNVIGASNNIANSNAMNQFAAQDAQLKRQNQGIYAGQVAQEQNRANQNTAMQFQQNQMAQRAWGQAGQQGVNNIFSGAQMGSTLLNPKDPNAGYSVTNPGDMNMQYPDNTYGYPDMNYGGSYGMPRNPNLGQPYQTNDFKLQTWNKPSRGIDWNNLY